MNLKKLKILYIAPILIIFGIFYNDRVVNATGQVCCYTANDKCQNFIDAALGKRCRILNEESCNQFIDNQSQEAGCTIGSDKSVQNINDQCQSFCAPYNPAPAPAKTDMPKLKMPELQISIPGLTLTKGDAIECKEVNGKKVCNIPWIGEYIAGIYKYAIGIVGILAAVVLMIGGVIWIVAGGSATMIGEAKAWIGASLTGLVIALCSYVILYQVNPALVGFNGLNITMVEKIKQLVEERTGGTATQYKNMPCPTSDELTTGVQIYTTGYYIPPRGNDHQSLCMIAMNCTCPGGEAGRDSNSNCDDIFPNFKNYRPCKPFSADTPYCNQTANNTAPQLGDGTVDHPTSVAAPDCIDFNTKLCIKGKNYIVTDRGSAITGKRIDIWSGNSIDTARNNSGITTIKVGSCN